MKEPTCARTICVVTLLLCCSAAGAQYNMPAPRPYTALPDTQPRTGTSLKARLAIGDIPLDKQYSELSLEQKNKFKSQYQSMSDDDEPPFPIDGLDSLYKPIVEAMQSLRLEGPLDMEVEVDSTGKAKSVSVRKSPSAQVTQVAAAALMFRTYKPAVCSGKPCASVFPLQADFVRR
jgi:hypothetical protein